jgi:hypothetical protein
MRVKILLIFPKLWILGNSSFSLPLNEQIWGICKKRLLWNLSDGLKQQPSHYPLYKLLNVILFSHCCNHPFVVGYLVHYKSFSNHND